MTTPRTIAQVTVAASGSDGAGVTLQTDQPDKFDINRVVTLYPSQQRDGSVLSRANSTVRMLVTAKPGGGQLTGYMNIDGFVDAPLVSKGWIIDGRTGFETGAPGGGSYTITDVTRTGIQAAIDAASLAGIVDLYIPGGLGVVVIDRVGVVAVGGIYTLITPKSHIHIHVGRGTKLAPPSDSSACWIFGFTGQATATHTITATMDEGVSQFTMAAGGVAAQGFADGSIVQIVDPGGGTVRNQLFRVEGAPVGEVVQTHQGSSWPFAVGDYAKRVTSFLEDFWVEGEFDVGANTGESFALHIIYHVDCDYTKVKTRGFSNTASQGAVFLGGGTGGAISDAYDKDSGSAGSGAWSISDWSNFTVEGSLLYPKGFGWQMTRCVQWTRSRSGAIGATGRGNKLDQCRDAADLFPVGDNCTASGWGVEFCNNIFVYRPHTHGNLYGIFFPGIVGRVSTNIKVIDPDSLGNGSDIYATDPMETNRISGGRYVTVWPLITLSTSQAEYGGYSLPKNHVSAAVHATNESTMYSVNVPAGELIKGLVAPMIRTTLYFNYLSPTNARTLTPRIKYGGTALVDDPTAAIAVNAAFRTGVLEFDTWNDGTNTIVSGSIRISAPAAAAAGIADLATADVLNHTFGGSVANGTEDPTLDQLLEVTFQHGGADVIMNVLRTVSVVR